MSSNNWIPPDVSSVCLNQQAPLTACSQTGYMFLALVTQLFGGTTISTNENKGHLHKGFNSFDGAGTIDGVSGPINSFQFGTLTSPAFETSFLSPTSQTPLGPLLESGRGNIETETHGLGPVLEQTPLFYEREVGRKRHHSKHHGVPSASFYMKKHNEPEIKFNFGEESFRNPFSEYLLQQPSYEYKFTSKIDDADVADSSKVIVKIKEKRKKGAKSRRKRHSSGEYDFIIVGAGSAGCVLANRLSEVKKWKILLLEAGPEEPDVTSVPAFAPTLARSSIDWMYRTQPEELTCRAQLGQTCPWLRGKVMGGSSSTNYLVYMRGNKQDYDDWANLGNTGWSYGEVLPYFKKSESNRDNERNDILYHGVEGPMNVERFRYADDNVHIILNAFKERKLQVADLNGENQIGTMITQTTSKDGKRVSSNEAFVKPIRNKRKNLFIRTSSEVTKILIEPHTKIAFGVKYLQDRVYYTAYAKKEVILSAGALNSPKILMLSGIGPKQDLESLNIPVLQNLPVGLSMQDHVTTNAMIMKLSNKTSTSVKQQKMLQNVQKFHKTKNPYNPLAATGPSQITAFIRTEFSNEDKSVPDVQFHFDGRNLKEFYADPTNYLETNYLPFSYYDSINVKPILLLPKSRGYLKLNKTHPVFGQPLIFSRFFTNKNDLDTLISALRFAANLENTESFRRHGVKFVKEPIQGCANYQWGTDEYFTCLLTHYTGTIFHPTGTCRMGPVWDKMAVVNPRLTVYGIRKLRVCDASIMPNIVRGNTHAPVVMIGEKAADLIKKDWMGKSMGGSSAINYMVYMRGNKKDYDNWAELGNHGWSYREVLPYFKKAENNQDIESHDKFYHSVGGPLNVERYPYIDINTMMLVEAFKEKGLPLTDFNGAQQFGTDIAQSTSFHGRRWSINTAYIRPIRHKRPNLHIVTHAFATKIIIDPSTKTAFGIQYIKDGRYFSVFAKKEVIISAGALNSPKLLMLSGIGPKFHLESLNIPVIADLKVGSNLMDHVTTDALIISLSNKTSTMVTEQQLLNSVVDYHEQSWDKKGPLSSSSTLSGVAFIKTQFSNEVEPDIQFHFDARNVREFYDDPLTYMSTNIFPLSFYDGIAARPLLLVPNSRGFILLNVTDPVFGQPLIYSRFFTDRRDVDTLVAAMSYAVSLEDTAAFRLSGARYVREPVKACVMYPWGSYEYFFCLLREYTSTIFHPAGTCKMGPHWDKDAVVDPQLRVHGLKKLRVIDASIMPVIIRGNLNAPTVMISEKASDMIKEDWISKRGAF